MGRERLAVLRAVGPASGEGEDADTSDRDLAARFARGDRAALDAVYQRYAPELFRMLLRLLSRTGEAEDVLQDTFLVGFHKAAQLRDGEALRGWLFRIAVREAHARLRRRRRWWPFGGTHSRDEDDAPLVTMIAPTVGGDARAELALLDRELAKLPAEQRVAWVLRYVQGESLEDVADACGCSLATVKRWIAAADHAVRRHVKIDEEGAGDG